MTNTNCAATDKLLSLHLQGGPTRQDCLIIWSTCSIFDAPEHAHDLLWYICAIDILAIQDVRVILLSTDQSEFTCSCIIHPVHKPFMSSSVSVLTSGPEHTHECPSNVQKKEKWRSPIKDRSEWPKALFFCTLNPVSLDERIGFGLSITPVRSTAWWGSVI